MTDYIVKPPPHKKYIREILAQLPKGVKIGMIAEASDGVKPTRPINTSHPCVLAPDGSLLRDADGRPVIVCSTPGRQGSIHKDVRGIKRALALLESEAA